MARSLPASNDYRIWTSHGQLRIGLHQGCDQRHRRLAEEIPEKGTCNLLQEGMQTADINALLARKQK